jgi:hypothetical protein
MELIIDFFRLRRFEREDFIAFEPGRILSGCYRRRA